MRENGLKRVRENFTWAIVANAISQVYEKVLYKESLPKEGFQNSLARVEQNFAQAYEVLIKSQQSLRIPIVDAAKKITNAFLKGNKVLICGNGGSSAEASHFAAELVGHFEEKFRQALPALALNTDNSFLTAWSNDESFEEIFSRQLQALGASGDILIGLSTSGNSKNLVRAFETAKTKGIFSIALLGKDGGELKNFSDLSIVVPSDNTQRIQEVQLTIIHTLCELVEKQLVASRFESLRPELWAQFINQKLRPLKERVGMKNEIQKERENKNYG